MAESENEVTVWEEEMLRQATAAAAMERPKVSAISLRAGVMTYMDVPLPGNKLNCIVVATCFERAVYDKWDPNVISPPLCFAQSLDGEDMAPSENVPEPFNETCLGCKYDAWKSDPGRKGKRCKEVRKLAVVAYNKDNLYEDAELATIRVPVTSVASWSTYVNKVSASQKRPYYAVITEISTTPDVRTQFKVNFKMVEKVDREAFSSLYKLRNLGETVLMTPYDLSAPQQEPVKDSAKY